MVEMLEVDIMAIIIASILGIILHALGILPEQFITSLILLLLALHALHEGLQARRTTKAHGKLEHAAEKLGEPEVKLITPNETFKKAEELTLKNTGEMWWFNTPLGFRNQRIFDKALKPAIESSRTSKIIFILDENFKKVWEEEVAPKIDNCKNKDKVAPPIWRKIEESFAFKMIDLSSDKVIKEAHLSFLEKPFMMKTATQETPAFYPRYIFHIKSHSNLVQELKDIFLEYGLK